MEPMIFSSLLQALLVVLFQWILVDTSDPSEVLLLGGSLALGSTCGL